MAGLHGSIAMSLTRPPIAAGPIDRALKFLNKTSVNFGGIDSATGEAVTVEVGELSGDAAGETVAVAAPGRAPTRVGDGVCAWRTATQLKPVKRMAVDLMEELDRIIQDNE
jgi:hypothetical protein